MRRIGEVIESHKSPRKVPREVRKIGVVEALVRKARKGPYPRYKTHIEGFIVKMEPGSLPEDSTPETGLIVDEGRIALRALYNLGKRSFATKRRLDAAKEAYSKNRDLLSELSQETGFRGMVIHRIGSISAYPSVELAEWDLKKVEQASGKLSDNVVNPEGVTFHVPLLARLGMSADELTEHVLARVGEVLETTPEETAQMVETYHYGQVYEQMLGMMIVEDKISLDEDAAKAKTTWKVDVYPLNT